MASTAILTPRSLQSAASLCLPEGCQLGTVLNSGCLEALLDAEIAGSQGAATTAAEEGPSEAAAGGDCLKHSAATRPEQLKSSNNDSEQSQQRQQQQQQHAAKLAAAQQAVRRSWQYQCTGSARAAAVLSGLRTRRLRSGGPAGLASFIKDLILHQGLEDTTFVYDLGNTTRLFQAWTAALPRVTPFYAVKCNPEPGLLRLLAALGAGFDCASKAELQAVLGLPGVSQDNIIFAHPCKRPCDIRFARESAVKLTTFDSTYELDKLAQGCPGIGLVLRLRCDDPTARTPLGLKYGANPCEAAGLLQRAWQLGMAVVGVSFHVGSGCNDLSAFSAAIATARGVFDAAKATGHDMTLLDIGGGFTGRFDSHGHLQFSDVARTISAALAQHFPAECGVRVIAEPGRFFAEASAVLAVAMYGKRDRVDAAGAPHQDVWVTDGTYGSFNNVLLDGQRPQPILLRSPMADQRQDAPAPDEQLLLPTTLWGPTCDSCDFIYKDVLLPRLDIGDWLLFAASGAYTVASACDFNGIAMSHPNKHFVFSSCACDDEGATAVGGGDGVCRVLLLAAECWAAVTAADGLLH